MAQVQPKLRPGMTTDDLRRETGTTLIMMESHDECKWMLDDGYLWTKLRQRSDGHLEVIAYKFERLYKWDDKWDK